MTKVSVIGAPASTMTSPAWNCRAVNVEAIALSTSGSPNPRRAGSSVSVSEMIHTSSAPFCTTLTRPRPTAWVSRRLTR